MPDPPGPLCLLDFAIVFDLGNPAINPRDIYKIRVYQPGKGPAKWRSLNTYGILVVRLMADAKVPVESLTLTEIGARLGLTGPIGYTLNGMPATDAHLRIATNAIGAIDVVPAGANVPTTLVAIKIARSVRKAPPTPPGLIRVRGTAAQLGLPRR